MTSECDAVNDKLRVGILKQCNGHDKIQSRGLYEEASVFRCQANIVMMFNEVPSSDDNSGVLERCLDHVEFGRSFVSDPHKPHERNIDRKLNQEFETDEIGAAFLGYLVDTFNTHGFEIDAPRSIIDSSQKYIKLNNVIMQFVDEAFDKTDDPTDTVLLKDAYNFCISLNYKD